MLAYKAVIVCSRYGATQSVTARVDIVIKQDLLWDCDTMIYQLCVVIYFFPYNFCHPIITIRFELFDAKLGLGHSGQQSENNY